VLQVGEVLKLIGAIFSLAGRLLKLVSSQVGRRRRLMRIVGHRILSPSYRPDTETQIVDPFVGQQPPERLQDLRFLEHELLEHRGTTVIVVREHLHDFDEGTVARLQ
jgi:hypothetical protein